MRAPATYLLNLVPAAGSLAMVASSSSALQLQLRAGNLLMSGWR